MPLLKDNKNHFLSFSILSLKFYFVLRNYIYCSNYPDDNQICLVFNILIINLWVLDDGS